MNKIDNKQLRKICRELAGASTVPIYKGTGRGRRVSKHKNTSFDYLEREILKTSYTKSQIKDIDAMFGILNTKHHDIDHHVKGAPWRQGCKRLGIKVESRDSIKNKRQLRRRAKIDSPFFKKEDATATDRKDLIMRRLYSRMNKGMYRVCNDLDKGSMYLGLMRRAFGSAVSGSEAGYVYAPSLSEQVRSCVFPDSTACKKARHKYVFDHYHEVHKVIPDKEMRTTGVYEWHAKIGLASWGIVKDRRAVIFNANRALVLQLTDPSLKFTTNVSYKPYISSGGYFLHTVKADASQNPVLFDVDNIPTGMVEVTDMFMVYRSEGDAYGRDVYVNVPCRAFNKSVKVSRWGSNLKEFGVRTVRPRIGPSRVEKYGGRVIFRNDMFTMKDISNQLTESTS